MTETPDMLRYILKRILVMIPTLILISMLVFTIIELPPGDYFESYVAELRAMGETANLAEIEELRVRYGFDQPAPNISCRSAMWWETACG
jgi:peptide/nickel transport system permease protein